MLYDLQVHSTAASHDYHGMVMDFPKPGSVNVSQADITQDIRRDRPVGAITTCTGTRLRSTRTPAAPNLFDVHPTPSTSLDRR